MSDKMANTVANGIATGDDSGGGGNSESAHDALPQVIGMLL